MTPTSTLSAATQAIDTQKCGTPRAKFAVPSIGSTTQAAPPSPAGRALLSSPMNPSLGNISRRRSAMNASVSPSTSVRKSCGPLKPTVNDWSRKRRRAIAPASRATACAASSRMSMSVEAPSVIVSPSKVAVGAVLKDDRIAVRSDEFRRPPTLDRFADERQWHARSRSRRLEGGRGFARRRGEKLIVVAAGRRNFEQVADRRRSPRARPATAADDRSARAR